MNATVASARGVVKTYGSDRAERRVLDGVDLDIAGGELVAILGRSGSGKSTLLHLLGGLDRPDAGTIEVGGVRLGRSERLLTEVRREHVGFVFQSFHLLPELTGLENALLPARLSRNGRAAPERVRALIESLGLVEAAGRLPGELSGGEQQRLAVVRALANDPALVLADEPTGNLDPDSAAPVLALLRRIADDGRAVLVVTHDDQATRLADRVLTLEGGKLLA
jgi:ABC-type lipoprotein export system ATPase subunit